jgi:hypothetical protein
MDLGGGFFGLCPLQYMGLHGPEKQDEMPLGLEPLGLELGAERLGAERQPASAGRREIGFIPFFRTNVRAY